MKKNKIDATTIWTAIIALATVVNLFVAIFMWGITKSSLELNREIFKASYRPFVGLYGIGKIIEKDEKKLHFTLELRNTGSVPARNIETNIDVKLNGSSMPITEIPQNVYTLFPDEKKFIPGMVGKDFFDSVMSGKTILEFSLKISYQGIDDEKYETYNVGRFVNNIETFITLGSSWN